MHFWVISARLPTSRVFIEHCPKLERVYFEDILEGLDRVYFEDILEGLDRVYLDRVYLYLFLV
ncbi:hypothetical protein Hanom_Chr14g01249511 [Helianthus anomalus]